MTPDVAPTRDDDLALALDAAREAGTAVMEWFRADPEVRLKSPDQPVTDADLRADALLRHRLLAARPDYGWLSEESVDRPDRLRRRRVWIVDPIDGTRSFIAGYREFAISVGLVEDGAAVIGVVHNPATREARWAVRGHGAFGSGSPQPLRMSAPRPGERPRLMASRSEIAAGEFDAFRDHWDLRPLGSTAWKLAATAAGAGHAYLSRGPKSEWDVVAGALLVEESGGVVTDLRGRGLVYNRRDPYVHGVLAALPGLHTALLEEAWREPAPRLRPGRAAEGEARGMGGVIPDRGRRE